MRDGHQGAGDVCGHDPRGVAAREGDAAGGGARSGARWLAELAATSCGGTGHCGGAVYYRVPEINYNSASNKNSGFWGGGNPRYFLPPPRPPHSPTISP